MKKQQYTLIELLVVIVIIAILAGIAIPVINRVRDQAKITRAKSDITAIKMALKSMENTYSGFGDLIKTTSPGYLDSKGKIADSDNYENLFTELSDPKKSGFSPALNKRKTIFIDYKKNGWKDPWGNEYIIYFDTNYDGKIKIGATDGSDNLDDADVVADTIAIYSKGPDKDDAKGENNLHVSGISAANKKDDIASW